MPAPHSACLVLPGEYVTTTRYPSSAILVEIVSPRPPMPPVTSTTRPLPFAPVMPCLRSCDLPYSGPKTNPRDMDRGGVSPTGGGPASAVDRLFACARFLSLPLSGPRLDRCRRVRAGALHPPSFWQGSRSCQGTCQSSEFCDGHRRCSRSQL